MSDLMSWVSAHFAELQMGALVITAAMLVLALILLNRTASELFRSRSQRVKSEQTFERINALLSAYDHTDNSIEELRGNRRVSMSGPVQRSMRPVAAKSEPKPAPRNEPKITPLATRVNLRKSFY